MKHSTLVGGFLAGLGAAAPLVARQSTNIDTTVLQFALTLEHLENVFYKNALTNFTQEDFAKAGYDATYYNNIKQIAYDEEQHVKLLSSALTAAGVTPNAACSYSFPVTDVKSFITLSSIVEGVGTSAYLGGAPLITSKAYLTVAGSILVTEALHTSYQRAAVSEVPFPSPYGTPLDPTSVFTLAAGFITSCPSSNSALPFTPFPALTYDAATCNKKREWVKTGHGNGKLEDGSDYSYDVEEWKGPWTGEEAWNELDNISPEHPNPTPTYESPEPTNNGSPAPTYPAQMCPPPAAGTTIQFTAASAIPAGAYLTFVSGLNIVSVQGSVSGNTISAAIPAVVAGQTYVFVSSSDMETTFDGTQVLFGPSIVEVQAAEPVIDFSYAKA